MTKITVLGGSGFLGSHLCDLLFQKKFRVIIYDKKKSKYLNKNQKFIEGDILDKNRLFKAIKEQIMFLILQVLHMDDLKYDPIAVKSNIQGTVNALEASSKFKIKKFIHASTIYANTEEGGFYGEVKKLLKTM